MLQVLVEAARPRTLPAAVAPVAVGTALADPVVPLHALLALVVALSLQVAVNYANDVFDGVAGVDTEERTGPRRVVAAGLASPTTMYRAIGAALLVAGLAGGVLALRVGPELLVVGAAAMLAALGYSGGSRPYASLGLGELFVFVFFGLVATVGTTYVQDGTLAADAWVAGTAMGLLSVALLVVNNLRDIPTDAATGKRTLAVRLGDAGTRRLFRACVVGALVLACLLVPLTGAGWALLALLSLPQLQPALLLVRHDTVGPRLVEALESTAKGQLVFGLGLSVGLALDRVLT